MDSRLVTIFGGTGFVGRHAVRALAKAGWRIRVAARRPNRGFFLRPLGQVGQIDFIKCDIRNADDVAAALVRAEAAVNLCGILFQRGQTFDDIHAEGAEIIAKAAAAAGLKALVHVSALGADSTSPSEYATTKAEGEARLREVFPDAVILRPSIVFGPEDKFFNMFADMARFLPALPLVGGGHTRFQPVFAGDVAAAIVKILGSEDACGRTYELGGPTVYTFRQLMQIVLTETGRKRVLVPLPFGLAMWKAAFLQFLPKPPLTPDQVRLLKADNVVAPTAFGFADLGIVPTSVEAEVPAYLWRFRAKGEYAELAKVS